MYQYDPPVFLIVQAVRPQTNSYITIPVYYPSSNQVNIENDVGMMLYDLGAGWGAKISKVTPDQFAKVTEGLAHNDSLIK